MLSSAALLALSCGSRHEPPVVVGAAGELGEGGSAASLEGGAGPVAGLGPRGGASSSTSGGEAGSDAPAGGRATGTGGTVAGGATDEAGAAPVDAGGASSGGGTSVVGPGPCGFHVEVAMSPAIGTVATVEWSLKLGNVEAAEIDFGLDKTYGLVAPVDLDEPAYRTWLLGMKPSRDYHARIVARVGDDECTSDDFVVTTGPVKNGLPQVTLTTFDAARTAGGYLVSAFLNKGPAFILDADGEYVWWGEDVGAGRALLSYDGKYMWYTAVNVRGGTPYVGSMRVDGRLTTEHPEFGDCHHDFTVLPDGTIGFIQHDGASDRIMERAPDGAVRKVVEVSEAHGGTTKTHTNSIHYHPGDDTYTFSDLNQNAYVKVKRTGEVVWILGGSTSDFSGDGAEWVRQHGHDLIAPDRLLFFNNGDLGNPGAAVEVSLDFEQMLATRVWSYTGSSQSVIFGDVQHLDNGNTLVTYSTAAAIEEVTPDGDVVQRTNWSEGDGIGYVSKRASLYGPPPDH